MENKKEYKAPAIIEIVAIVEDCFLQNTSGIQELNSYQFEE